MQTADRRALKLFLWIAAHKEASKQQQQQQQRQQGAQVVGATLPENRKEKKYNAGADELALQNRENQLKNLQHQSNKRVARAAAPQGKRETEKAREREREWAATV